MAVLRDGLLLGNVTVEVDIWHSVNTRTRRVGVLDNRDKTTVASLERGSILLAETADLHGHAAARL